jgi:ATP-dependent RNA helicase DeaD
MAPGGGAILALLLRPAGAACRMEKRLFAELGLSPELLKAVDKMGFEEAAPIQTAVIPLLLAGRDVVGQSATGSGKTAAFALPAIERVDAHVRAVQVLILCPTRELAVQVAEETGKLALFKRGVHSVPIYGGQSYERQFRALAAGVQIVIGTPRPGNGSHGTRHAQAGPGCAWSCSTRPIGCSTWAFATTSSASSPPHRRQRQMLFFSATMPRPIQDLIGRYTKNPEWVRIEAHAQNAPQVEQIYFEVDRRSKIEVLTRLIDLHDFRYGLIFCSTKIMVDELDEHLHARGYAVDRLHGDMSQAQRDRVMEKFRRRGFEFLVATDVAARGLDLDDLEVVFNFDLPNDAEDYIHRIGRTGRAGKTGRAFTFVSGRELYKLQNMVRFGQLKIRRERVPSLDQVEEARENVFFEKLRATLDAGTYRKQDRMIDRLLEQGYPSTDIAAALIHLLQGQGAPAEPAKAALSADAPSWAMKKMADPKPAASPAKAAIKASDKPTGEAPAPLAAAGQRDLGIPLIADENRSKTNDPVTTVARALPVRLPSAPMPSMPPGAGPERRVPQPDRPGFRQRPRRARRDSQNEIRAPSAHGTRVRHDDVVFQCRPQAPRHPGRYRRQDCRGDATAGGSRGRDRPPVAPLARRCRDPARGADRDQACRHPPERARAVPRGGPDCGGIGRWSKKCCALPAVGSVQIERQLIISRKTMIY